MNKNKTSKFLMLMVIILSYVFIVFFFVAREQTLKTHLGDYIYSAAEASARDYYNAGQKFYYRAPSDNRPKTDGIPLVLYPSYNKSKICFLNLASFSDKYIATFNKKMNDLIKYGSGSGIRTTTDSNSE